MDNTNNNLDFELVSEFKSQMYSAKDTAKLSIQEAFKTVYSSIRENRNKGLRGVAIDENLAHPEIIEALKEKGFNVEIKNTFVTIKW